MQRDRLAGGDLALERPHFHDHPAQFRCAPPNLLQYFYAGHVPLAALEHFDEHGADSVRAGAALVLHPLPLGLPRAGCGEHVQIPDARNLEHRFFHLGHQPIGFFHVQIAAGANEHLGVGGVVLVEEEHAQIARTMQGEYAEHQRNHGGDRNQGMAHGQRKQAAVSLRETAQPRRVQIPHAVGRCAGGLTAATPAPERRAQNRGEYQGVEQRPDQHPQQGNGQIPHKGAGHAGPEHQRHEGGQGGGGGGEHGQKHPLRRCAIGRKFGFAFGNSPFRVLGDHDGAVDQHAQPQQHAEHDHEVERVAEQPQENEGEQEGNRDGAGHQQAASYAHCREYDQHHQHQRGHDIALQLHDLLGGELGGVLRVEHVYARGQPLAEIVRHLAHRGGRFDAVGSRAPVHEHRNGLLAIGVGVAGAVLEGAPHRGHIAQGHDRVAFDSHRNIEQIGGGLDDAGHLHRNAALGGIHGAGGDQPVIAGKRRVQLLHRHPVGGELLRPDEDFHELLAVPLQGRQLHLAHRFDSVAKPPRGGVERFLRSISAHQIDLQHGIVGRGGFLHNRLFGGGRELGLGPVHGLAHIAQRRVQIDSRGELHRHLGHVLGARSGNFPHPFHGLEFDFQRQDQQPPGVFRRDALVNDGDDVERNFDAGFALHRDRHARDDPEDHDSDHRQQRGSPAFKR